MTGGLCDQPLTCKFDDTYYLKESCNGSSFMSLTQKLVTSDPAITESCNRVGSDNLSLKEWYEFTYGLRVLMIWSSNFFIKKKNIPI